MLQARFLSARFLIAVRWEDMVIMADIVDTSKFYPGMKLKWEGGLWEIVECQHHMKGRGGATLKCKFRNLETGSVAEPSFVAGKDAFERIVFDEKPAQYSYKNGDTYVFMDMENYEEIYFTKETLGNALYYLTDNLEVNIDMYEGRVMGVTLPNSVVLKVVETQPNYKGDTAAGGGKPAKLETGLVVNVPMFVLTGEDIVVDTRTGEYVERAKK